MRGVDAHIPKAFHLRATADAAVIDVSICLIAGDVDKLGGEQPGPRAVLTDEMSLKRIKIDVLNSGQRGSGRGELAGAEQINESRLDGGIADAVAGIEAQVVAALGAHIQAIRSDAIKWPASARQRPAKGRLAMAIDTQ